MTSINDFGSTYMCQSLPFGGVKDSGFDRFAGIEGLRGLCVPKAVCQDRSAHLSEQAAAGRCPPSSHQCGLSACQLSCAYCSDEHVVFAI